MQVCLFQQVRKSDGIECFSKNDVMLSMDEIIFVLWLIVFKWISGFTGLLVSANGK